MLCEENVLKSKDSYTAALPCFLFTLLNGSHRGILSILILIKVQVWEALNQKQAEEQEPQLQMQKKRWGYQE